MSREPNRLADLRDPASPEAALLRDVIRAQQGIRPTAGKMAELAGRLGPILEAKSAPPAPRTTWLAASVAAVAAVAAVTVTVQMTVPSANEAPPSATRAAAPAERDRLMARLQAAAVPRPSFRRSTPQPAEHHRWSSPEC